jgi:hypothetical protein
LGIVDGSGGSGGGGGSCGLDDGRKWRESCRKWNSDSEVNILICCKEGL